MLTWIKNFKKLNKKIYLFIIDMTEIKQCNFSHVLNKISFTSVDLMNG